MASINELKEALKEHLEQKGIMNKLRSELRAEIYQTLNEQSGGVSLPTNENYIINELIKEYLLFNKHHYTLSVFESECGNDKKPLEREFISQQLKVVEDNSTINIPLLYPLIYGTKTKISDDKKDSKIFKPLK